MTRTEDDANPAGPSVRRRLFTALASLVLLVVLCGIGSVTTAVTSRRSMATAHRFETAARRAASLGMIAREQYIHEAHLIIEGDRAHVDHHDEWVSRFEKEATLFRADLGPEGVRRVDEIMADSRALAQVFGHEIVPAVARGDVVTVTRSHEHANALVDRMTAHADALADEFERRAVEAERAAEATSSIMLPVAVVSCIGAALFAFGVARRLWTSIATPLDALRSVADRVTSGDRAARVGPLVAEELAVVGLAFDGMLDALAEKEVELVGAERFAAIGRVAAGVAHEINNPIGVIRGYLKTMRSQVTDAAITLKLDILDEEAAICQRIAEDLLAYTRSRDLRLVEIDALELVTGAVERWRAGGEPGRAHDAMVHVSPATLRVDPVRIRQVFMNLLRNAFDAGGASSLEIVGQADSGRGVYTFRVRDRGPGFSPEARAHLFEPFFTTRSDGTGLGLAVCYGLVTAHHGTIRAEDREGGGAEIVVELPVPR